MRLGQTQVALADAEQAVSVARDVGNPEGIAFSLATRAESHLALGDLEAAYRDNAEALGVVEEMRRNLSPEDRYRQNFSDTLNELFTSAIRVLTRLGRHAEALDVAEQARARAFLDLLASRDVTAESAPGARETERRRLIAEAPLSHDAMRAALAGLHSTLVSYWVAPDGAHVWVIGDDGIVHGRRLTVTASRLRSLIGAMTKAGAQPLGAAVADPARLLYDQLVKPIETWLPTTPGSLLTIVPTDRSSGCRSRRCATQPGAISSSVMRCTTSRRCRCLLRRARGSRPPPIAARSSWPTRPSIAR